MTINKEAKSTNYFSFFIFHFSLLLLFTTGTYADFSKSGNIVFDDSTNLEWQDDDIGSSTRWEDAIHRCEALVLGGHDDWRLPNINELLSLIDDSKNNPSIDTTFQNVGMSYWSSTGDANPKLSIYNVRLVSFYSNRTLSTSDSKNIKSYVRCVR